MAPTLPHQLEQAATRMFIVLVFLQMVSKLLNSSGQQGYLHLWRTGIVGVPMEILNHCFFFYF